AHVARFGERGGVADRKRHIENLGEGAGQECLAAARRPNEKDIALVDLDIVVAFVAQAQALVVVVHGNGKHLLGTLLTDDILVDFFLDGAGTRNIGEERLRTTAAALFLVDDRLTKLDAFAADVDIAGALYQRPHVSVTLAAKRTISIPIAPRAAGRSLAAAAGTGVFRRHALSLDSYC